MKTGHWVRVLFGTWAVYFIVAFLLDIGHRSIEFPGIRAVVSDALGTLMIALITTGVIWLYLRMIGKRHAT